MWCGVGDGTNYACFRPFILGSFGPFQCWVWGQLGEKLVVVNHREGLSKKVKILYEV